MGSFVLGAALLVLQANRSSPDPVLIAAGLALIGVTGSGRLQEWSRNRTPTPLDEEE